MRAPATVSAHLIFSSVPRSGIYLSAAGSPLVPAPLGSESTPSRPRCTRYSTVTANVLHTMLHPRKMKAQSKEKIFCRGRATKQQISTPRQTSSVSYICGHRLLHIRRHAGESETRARPRKPTKLLSRPWEKPQIALQGKPLWSPVYAVIGVFTLKEKQASPEIRARPRTPTKLLSRPREKKSQIALQGNPLWSPAYAVTGFFTLKETQVSPEIRARQIHQKICCRGRGMGCFGLL